MLIKLNNAPTDEQLKQLHKQYISGSQVNEILNRPWDNLRMLFDEPKLDDPYANVANKEYVLARGKLMESYIFEMAKQAFPNELSQMKLDKNTYHIMDTPFAFNIDGYIGTDINRVEAVVEIKTTRDRDVLSMLDKGWIDQMKFYCMCLKTNKAYLVGLYASDLQITAFEFSDAELNDLRIKLNDFALIRQKAVAINDFTLMDDLRTIKQNATINEYEIENADQLNTLETISQKVVLEKQLKKEIEAFKDSIKQIYGKSFLKWTNPSDKKRWCVETTLMNRKTTNWEGVISDIVKEYKLINIDKIGEIIKRHSTTNDSSVKTSIRPLKAKEEK